MNFAGFPNHHRAKVHLRIVRGPSNLFPHTFIMPSNTISSKDTLLHPKCDTPDIPTPRLGPLKIIVSGKPCKQKQVLIAYKFLL